MSEAPKATRSLTWLRRSATGRQVKYELRERLAEARRVYESEPASEAQRQIVLAYRDTLNYLFGDRCEP